MRIYSNYTLAYLDSECRRVLLEKNIANHIKSNMIFLISISHKVNKFQSKMFFDLISCCVKV